MTISRHKIWLIAGAVLGALGVSLGAFGAHGLESMLLDTRHLSDYQLDRQLANWETAARYQVYHALALLAVGVLAARRCTWAIHLAGAAMTLGTLIFCGCLYAVVLTGISLLGRFVPIGGLLMILGWVCLAAAAWQLPGEGVPGACRVE
jgi:uncharacterized membrane protein YgdD (TMEM256/DUF423 family)